MPGNIVYQFLTRIFFKFATQMFRAIPVFFGKGGDVRADSVDGVQICKQIVQPLRIIMIDQSFFFFLLTEQTDDDDFMKIIGKFA